MHINQNQIIMKTLALKLSILILIIGLSINAFTQTINIDSTFYADTEIYPFSQIDSIYGLNITGSCQLNSDTSLIRVILGTSEEEYMIFESYPLITQGYDSAFSDICDETCFLNEEEPLYISIEIINASIYIDDIIISNVWQDNLTELQYQSKRITDQTKIEYMNQNILDNRWNWIADSTEFVKQFYFEKKNYFGEKYNLYGIEYYVSGIYDNVFSENITSTKNLDLVPEFDWRKKHDAHLIDSKYWDGDLDEYELGNGWITGIRNQKSCESCSAFGSIATLESSINLYYNYHVDSTEELRLSEKDAFNCSLYPPGQVGCTCSSGKEIIVILNFIRQSGVVNEECYEYVAPYCEGFGDDCYDFSTKCTDPIFTSDITGSNAIAIMDPNTNEETLKTALIENGPLVIEVHRLFNPTISHVVSLVGFEKDDEDRTIWIMKNSWGLQSSNGYVYSALALGTHSNAPYIESPARAIIEPTIYHYPPVDYYRHCYDKDKDGYCNWGIGEKPATCSQNCHDAEDSNDNNRRIGPYDDNYYGVPVKPEMIVEHNNLEIENGGFLTFYENSGNVILNITIRNEGNAQLNFYPEDMQPIPDEIVSSSNPDVFEITSIPPANIEMNVGETTFQITYHYTSGPGNDNAIITINTIEFDFEPFKFFIENNDCFFNPEVEEISEIVNWPDWAVKSSNVLIKDGAELNITGNYGFVKDASLFIEPGGKVTIDGGVLTKACLNKWQGVDVWGNTNLSQYPTSNQGYIKIINNGSIRNAETGIQAAQIINGLYVSGTTGGIISCNSAIFKDNISDVIIYPFENTNPGTGEEAPNFCSFTNAQFINTTVCEHDPYVNLWGVDGIRFRGCSFINELTKSDCPIGYNKGTGIRSFSSGFYIDDYCVNNTYLCDETKQCHFENLEYGIYAFNGELSKYISIDTAVFVNNKTGIYMSMVENQTITQNKFVYDDTHDLSDDTPVGLYLETCTGYYVEENIFSNNAQDLTSLGIQIVNSGSAYNEIYNNTFENLNTGISAAGENRDAVGNGLCIKCNDFEECVNDIYVTNEGGNTNLGIAFAQGEVAPQPPPYQDPDPTYAAGNNFSDFTGINYNYINLEACNQIEYTYHGNYDDNKYKLIPDPRYPQAPSTHIDLNPDPEVWYNSKSEACPSNFGSIIDFTAEKSMFESELVNVDAYQDTLSMFVDGGDTDGLNLNVQLSFPDEALEVRQELLDESPYLSDTVIKSAISKENVLPNAMIRDVLVANPQSAKSTNVIQSLDNRYNPMPDYMMNEIMQGQTVYGAKELLEQKLSKHKTKRDKSLSKLIRHYKSDTSNIAASTDSIISLFQNQNYSSPRYRLAMIYLCENDSASAFSTLNNIPVEFNLTEKEETTHDFYLDLFDIQWEIASDTNGIDSLQIAALLEIAGHQYTMPSVYARNILVNAGEIIYNELVYLPDLFKVTPIWHKGNNNVIKPSLLKVFPNPASSYFIAEYILEDAIEKVYLILTEMNGKPIKTIYLAGKQNQIIVPIRDLPCGIYIIQLVGNKKVLESKKLTILK